VPGAAAATRDVIGRAAAVTRVKRSGFGGESLEVPMVPRIAAPMADDVETLVAPVISEFCAVGEIT
jgi:hypothetical protein